MATNTWGKMVKRDAAHAVCTEGDWTWYVLKAYQSPEAEAKNAYARAFCLVVTPFTGPRGDMGDIYCNDIPGYRRARLHAQALA